MANGNSDYSKPLEKISKQIIEKDKVIKKKTDENSFKSV